MNTTNKLLDAVKKQENLRSDYALAKFLGIATNRISNYRVGRSHFDELMAFRVAALLNMDPAEVVATVHMERAKRPEEVQAWRDILKHMGSAAASLTLVISGVFTSPTTAQAAEWFRSCCILC